MITRIYLGVVREQIVRDSNVGRQNVAGQHVPDN